MKPVVDRLSPDYAGTVDFFVYAEVNSEPESGAFANEHGVRAIPTMVIVSADGEELDRIIGAVPESELRAKLDAAR